jgi:hypothetical protein
LPLSRAVVLALAGLLLATGARGKDHDFGRSLEDGAAPEVLGRAVAGVFTASRFVEGPGSGRWATTSSTASAAAEESLASRRASG